MNITPLWRCCGIIRCREGVCNTAGIRLLWKTIITTDFGATRYLLKDGLVGTFYQVNIILRNREKFHVIFILTE